MIPIPSNRFFLAALLAIHSAAPAWADKLTKAEIGQAGKAATAFVEVPGRGTGSAFCVHASGLFLTNEHVVRGTEKTDIKLVLDSGLKTQRVLAASIVRVDKDLDLALLRATTTDPLAALALGTDDGITELVDVVAFGFPLGAAMAPDKKEYPPISVNAGSVASLRRKGGELDRIQLDISVTFGSSGGPVLDEKAKVIGVIVSGVPGQRGINLAIPVSHVTRFLSVPTVRLTAPELTRPALEQPQQFKAKVASFLPGAKDPTLKLVLIAGDQPAREFPMKGKDGIFEASAVPVPKTGGGRVEVSIRLGSGTVAGLTDDITVQIGGKPVKLSQLRRFEVKPKPSALLADGRTVVDGEIGGLGPIEIILGDDKVKLDLRKASQVQVTPVAEIFAVTATVVVSVDGKEVTRTEQTIPVRDATVAKVADPSSVPITPPTLAENKEIKRLPEAFADVCLGGGGRYLIFHLPKLKKLAVFDFNEGKITNYIPVSEDKVVLAAGLEKLVIGMPKKGVLERWSLTTFERESNVFPPFSEEIKGVFMGHASNGPVVVNNHFFDLATLKQLPIKFAKDGWEATATLFTSADGTVFARWGEEAVTFILEGDLVRGYREGGLGHVIPGPDGKSVFTSHGVVTPRLTRREADDAQFGYCLPAVRGKYFLALTSAAGGKGGRLAIYLLGYSKPIAKPDDIEHGLTFNDRDREPTGAWSRVFFVPQANLIAVLPVSNDQIVLHKFDIDAALEKSSVDYLFVTSQPPESVKAGTTLNYPIVVRAKRKPVAFKLETGPKGMTVSSEGVVTWAAPADAPTANQDAILSVRDAGGQEVFHTFTIRVVK
jgi:Trypsin-like peptidase domain